MIKRLSNLRDIFFSAFIYILLAATFSIASVSQNGYSSLCAKGVGFLKENRADSALFYFSQAFREGMPQDSFYYFWAESYLNKGSADSAFVLNYSIRPGADTSFKKKVLEQRYVIYSSLGWDDKAKAVLDSITSNITVDKKDVWRLFLPSLSLRTSGSMNTSKEDQMDYPFPEAMDSRVITGPGYRGQMMARWTLPLYKSIFFLPGIGYSIRNAGRKDISRDSIGKNLSLSGDISFGKLFDINYTWRRSDVQPGQVDFMHDISISKIMSADKWNAMLFGDISLLKSNSLGYSGKYGTVFAYFDRQLHNKHTISSSFLGYSQWFSPDTISRIPKMFVDDVTKAPGSVVHFYKDSLSKPIPSDFPPVTLPDYKSNVEWMYQIVPSTNYNFTNTFNYSIPIIWKMNVSFSFENSLLWYPQAYTWFSFSSEIPKEEFSTWKAIYLYYKSDSLWSAYNMKDGKCYFAMPPKTISGGIEDLFSSGPVTIDYVKKIRIDNTLSFSVGLGK